MNANARQSRSRLAIACAVRLYQFLRGHCYACAQLLPRSHYGQKERKKQNCITLENENNCAHFATGGVSKRRH